MRKLIPVFFMVLSLGLGLALFRGAVAQADGRAISARPAAPAGSGFTYQGRLEVDGAPANDSYDFQFRLFDAATGGDQVGSTVTVPGVTVTDGFFSVLLDFGAGAFDGQARWLEVAVREGGSDGAYTPLPGLQQLTPAPYAFYAAEAGSVAWSSLTDVPPGFADGVDDVGLTAVDWTDVQNRPPGLDDGDDDTTYTAGTGLALAGTTFSAAGSPYANVLVVAKSGGDFGSVQAALDSIGDAGPNNPYLVYVAPGVYTETVTLKSYVTVEGAGEGATVIRGTGGSQHPTSGSDSVTLIGADDAALRHLTVESVGTEQTFGVAIWNNNASPALTNVTAFAEASFSYGVYNISSSPKMSHVTTTAVSGSFNGYGVVNYLSSSPTMSNVTATGLGTTNSYGVYNEDSSSPTMTNVTATASDASSSYSYGVYNESSSPTIRYSTLEGGTASVNRVGGGTVRVANSQLLDAPGSGVICFNNYDQNLALVNCP